MVIDQRSRQCRWRLRQERQRCFLSSRLCWSRKRARRLIGIYDLSSAPPPPPPPPPSSAPPVNKSRIKTTPKAKVTLALTALQHELQLSRARVLAASILFTEMSMTTVVTMSTKTSTMTTTTTKKRQRRQNFVVKKRRNVNEWQKRDHFS